jgi:hypothetical protein
MPNLTEEQRVEQEKAKQSAYSAATTRLRGQNRDEFDALLEEEYGKRGLTYTRRPSKEDKAKQQIKAILDEFPDLRDEVLGGE